MKAGRLLIVLLCAVLLLCWFPGRAQAAQGEELTWEEAVTAVRAALVQRELVITVSVRSDTALAGDVGWVLYSQAISHTGVPNEGDYIRRNLSGCSYNSSYTVENGVYHYTITIMPNWLSSHSQEQEVDAAVDSLLGELNLWNATNYEKIVGVYNWITENVQYDFDNLDDDSYMLKYTTYSAIIQRETVCQGYASLLYRMLLSLGVDCRVISGVAGGENHAWNIVYLDGKYYNVDATWDRDLMGYYRNFLCTQANFTDHSRDNEFNTADFHARYPMAVTPYVLNVAASGTIQEGLEWVLDGDTGTLTVSGTGALPSYRYNHAPWYPYRESVRSIVVSEGITEVGERAFYWCTNCTSVSLPDSLTAIRQYGFNNLRALEQITLPENLQIIEFCAFSECAALKSITIPNSVRTLGTSVFSNCPGLTSATLGNGITSVPDSLFFNDGNLRTVVIPEGITAIEDTVFSGTALRSFHFPATLTRMGYAPFGDCSRMQEFTVAEDNPSFKGVNGVLFTKDGKTLLSYPGGKYGAYTVPEGTEVIADGAFRGVYNLTSVTFSSTLREIGDYSFSYCIGLRSVTFPENVTLIRDSAFRSCINLRTITFENQSVTLESGGVFAECDTLVSVTLPTNLQEIPGYLFYGCARLRNITIPSTVRSIGSSAFLDCDSLQTLVIPGNVRTIGRQAFDFCNLLETVILQEGVATLADYSIRNCPNLMRVVLPKSLTSIGRECFDMCPLVNLEFNCGTYAHSFAVSRGIDYTASHPYGDPVDYAPTCTEPGYTWYGCACGMFGERYNVVPAAGHTPYEDIYPSSCIMEGYYYCYCLECGEILDEWLLPLEDHDWVTGDVINPPTCLEEGLEYVWCSYCGYGEQREVPRLPHDYRSVTTDPDCIAEGYSTHTCELCGDSYTDSYTDALGHNWDEGTVTKEPTETETGIRLHTCLRCGVREEREIPTIDHVHGYEAVVTAPTCIAQGYTTHTCRCGDSYIDSYTDALGHNMSQWAVTVMPGCETPGQETTECVREGCGYRETRQVPAAGHSFGNWREVTAATCTQQGSERRDCANCDQYETRELPATGHDYTAEVTAPTCSDQGYTTHTCLHCGHSYIEDYVPALGHSWGDWTPVSQPTCTQKGSECRDCINCGQHETRDIAATGHSYTETVTPPTCTARGYTTHSCISCSHSYTDSFVDPTGHSFGSWTVVTEATCTETGTERRNCANCSHFEIRETDAIGHSYTAAVTAPTCTERGYTTHTCTNCGDSYVDAYVDATGHSFGSWTVVAAATCTEKGSERRDCANCDHYETREIAATGHNYTAAVTPPTCTDRGYTTHTCTNCGDSYVDSYVDATGHSFGSWTVVTAATCTEKGSERRDCANCDHYETREIAAIGHNYTAAVTAPTCTDRGYTTHTCTNCGDSYEDSYVDPTGHSFDHGSCTVCGETDPGYHVPGDITGDGLVNNKDLTRLFRHLSGYEVEVNEAALDITGDGLVNNKDLTRLFRHLSGYEVEMH